MSQFNQSFSTNQDMTVAMFADCLANSKEIFELIERIFPADSCRHYRVLPLSLNGSNLEVGAIDPKNEESLKFITSIAKVFKYNLNLKLIDDQTLQIILASYPQNSPQSEKQNRDRDSDRNRTVIDATVIDEAFRPDRNPPRRAIDSAPTLISQPETSQSSSQNSNISSSLDGLPADLDFLKDIELTPKQDSQTPKGIADKTATLYEIPPEFLNQAQSNQSNQSNRLDDKQTIIGGNPAELLAQENLADESEIALAEAQISDLIAEVSQQMKPQARPEKVDFLAELNFNLSWQKLLEASFQHNTEEIQLTRHSDFGTVVTRQNKSLQSSLEEIPLPIFCSLIDEIKRMAKIPLDLSNHPKKVVLERFYQEERILLRLAFSEEDREQVLLVKIFRGQNLAVYEQQQMDKVSEQALYLARQLEKTLRKIQACFYSAEFKTIKDLQAVQSRINHQLRLLEKK